MEEFKKIRLFKHRDFSENFDTALNFVKQNYAAVIRCVSFLIPVLLIALFFQPNANSIYKDLGAYDSLRNIYTVGYFAANFLIICVSLMAWLITIAYMSAYTKTKDGNIDTKEVWIKAGKAFLPLFGMSIIFWIIVGISSIFCLIPGVIVFVYLGFFMYVYINEDAGFIESFQRSYELVSGNFWVTLGFGLVFSLLIFVGQLIFAIPTYLSMFGLAFEIDFLRSEIYGYMAGLISNLGGILLYPILYMAMGVMYYSLRSEMESIDMEDDIDLIGTIGEDNETGYIKKY